ncbi:hypothetical protein PMAYCL1PPCAC_21242 [Pristionchus mayeri]|uniref:Uncharacterized protein n=1 Tax=Pristionchus mayeri TaxID=1317129 RepID=A0AAN5CUV7_9BILA|nr:hypothetical protein PMAYCL1PPCAC_21242 [Pristionchus mayeri]
MMKRHQEIFEACLKWNDTSVSEQKLRCKDISRAIMPHDNCDRRRELLEYGCLGFARDLSPGMEKMAFPDGRSINFVVWSCSELEVCSNYSCAPTFSNFDLKIDTPSPKSYNVSNIIMIIAALCNIILGVYFLSMWCLAKCLLKMHQDGKLLIKTETLHIYTKAPAYSDIPTTDHSN